MMNRIEKSRKTWTGIMLLVLLVGCIGVSQNITPETPSATVTETSAFAPADKNETSTPTLAMEDSFEFADEVENGKSPSQTPRPLPSPLQKTPGDTPVAGCKSVPDSLKKYLGIKYPPMPDGFSEGGGWLISADETYPNSDFGIDIVHFESDYLLFFGKFSGRDRQGHAIWTLLDILVLPELESQQVLVSDGCKIGRDGNVDQEILAISSFDHEAEVSRYATNDKILRAWRANRSTRAIEEIATDRIECYLDTSSWLGNSP